MLHITNGDSAASLLRQAGLSGEVLPWRDLLHEGPVPAGLSLEELSEIRARYLADQGMGVPSEIAADFARRDAALHQAGAYDAVVLWFEHDLYDQLQLIQILDWFVGQQFNGTRLDVVSIGAYPGVEPFHGLGQLTPRDLAQLYTARRPIGAPDLALAHAAWAAFTSANPAAIQTLLEGDITVLPFLRGALVRHLEQFPALIGGLSRTERQALGAVAAGAREPADIFQADQQMEAAPFMGDLAFWKYLARLSTGPTPLLVPTAGGAFVAPGGPPVDPAFLAQSLQLTEDGRSVLDGQADQVSLNGIDRWLGGVHLSGHTSSWRWDAAQDRLVYLES